MTSAVNVGELSLSTVPAYGSTAFNSTLQSQGQSNIVALSLDSQGLWSYESAHFGMRTSPIIGSTTDSLKISQNGDVLVAFIAPAPAPSGVIVMPVSNYVPSGNVLCRCIQINPTGLPQNASNWFETSIPQETLDIDEAVRIAASAASVNIASFAQGLVQIVLPIAVSVSTWPRVVPINPIYKGTPRSDLALALQDHASGFGNTPFAFKNERTLDTFYGIIRPVAGVGGDIVRTHGVLTQAALPGDVITVARFVDAMSFDVGSGGADGVCRIKSFIDAGTTPFVFKVPTVSRIYNIYVPSALSTDSFELSTDGVSWPVRFSGTHTAFMTGSAVHIRATDESAKPVTLAWYASHSDFSGTNLIYDKTQHEHISDLHGDIHSFETAIGSMSVFADLNGHNSTAYIPVVLITRSDNTIISPTPINGQAFALHSVSPLNVYIAVHFSQRTTTTIGSGTEDIVLETPLLLIHDYPSDIGGSPGNLTVSGSFFSTPMTQAVEPSLVLHNEPTLPQDFTLTAPSTLKATLPISTPNRWFPESLYLQVSESGGLFRVSGFAGTNPTITVLNGDTIGFIFIGNPFEVYLGSQLQTLPLVITSTGLTFTYRLFGTVKGSIIS